MREESIMASGGNAPPPKGMKKEGKRKWAIRIAILIIIILLILLGLYRCGCSGSRSQDGVIIGAGVKAGKIDRRSANDRKEANSNGKSAMTVRMNGYPVFADGESEGNLNIENPAVNELCMKVEIVLNSTGEVIYTSGAIPPDHYIDNDKLAKILEKGTYEATAHVMLIDPDHPDYNYNSAKFKLVITIEN